VRFGLDVAQHQLTFDEIVERAKLAEDAGFDGVWVFDHFKALYADPKGPSLEAWTLLAGLARETTRVRLGPLVTGMTHRNPSVLATEVVTVDHLSGGRVECAVGGAWNEPEHRELGIEFPSARDRMDRLEEGVQVLRKLFTEDDVTFEGRHYQLRDATYRPRPVQQPHPPIWVGGHGRASLRRAAEVGAAWHPINRSADELRAGRAELARLCQARGRATPPAIALRNDLCVLRPGRPAGTSVRGGSVLVGEPAALVERLLELREVGVEHLVIEFLAADGPELDEQMALFAERIRPKLA
jgi:probable F420-dependent oxidoreductase